MNIGFHVVPDSEAALKGEYCAMAKVPGALTDQTRIHPHPQTGWHPWLYDLARSRIRLGARLPQRAGVIPVRGAVCHENADYPVG
jgi:hypothetical protein